MIHIVIFNEEDMKRLNEDKKVILEDPITRSTTLFFTEKGYREYCAEDDLS